MQRIDLNADLGEEGGHDHELLDLVSSASICCGVHAGGPLACLTALAAAASRGVVVGAHPGHADRAGMGRVRVDLAAREMSALVEYQVGALTAVAELAGARLAHLKPHGALYHQATDDIEIARLIAATAARWRLAIYGPPQSCLEEACRGLALFVPEGFVDRRIHDPAEALDQALRQIDLGVGTLCVHGDTPAAVVLATAVRHGLERRGMFVRPPAPQRNGHPKGNTA
jgi:5-oxoprolinase (ATP-hydrolysing) subunit A